jgi:large subunit ribosomal protein L24
MDRLQRGDLVAIISGKYKGKQGRIKKILGDEGKVIVEGVNLVKRHTRPNSRTQQGGIVEKEAPLFACKVMPIDPTTKKPTRVRIATDKDDNKTKIRVAKSGAEIRAER